MRWLRVPDTQSPTGQLGVALLASNGVSLLLFALRVLGADSYRYWFLIWNLMLAWLPVLFAGLLVRRLPHSRWQGTTNTLLTIAWLLFLPNSFYVLSDLIHLQTTGEIGLLYDAVMFCSFIINAFIAGYLSTYLIHRELLKRMVRRQAHLMITVAFLLCGFAVYLGRELRWNSWDIVLHPAGIVFDTSEGLVNPVAHPQLFVTTGSFFAVIGMTYVVLWQIGRVVRLRSER